MVRKTDSCAGFTLIETMVSVGVMALVMGALYVLTVSLTQTAKMQDAKATGQDEVRNAMLRIVRELRGASGQSIAWNQLPASHIWYRVAEDTDGNGTAVDQGCNLELGPFRVLGVDFDDVNNDDLYASQVVLGARNSTQVIANGLSTEIVDANSEIGRGTDGFWIEQWGAGLRVTLRARRRPEPNTPEVVVTLTEVVNPRN